MSGDRSVQCMSSLAQPPVETLESSIPNVFGRRLQRPWCWVWSWRHLSHIVPLLLGKLPALYFLISDIQFSFYVPMPHMRYWIELKPKACSCYTKWHSLSLTVTCVCLTENFKCVLIYELVCCLWYLWIEQHLDGWYVPYIPEHTHESIWSWSCDWLDFGLVWVGDSLAMLASFESLISWLHLSALFQQKPCQYFFKGIIIRV